MSKVGLYKMYPYINPIYIYISIYVYMYICIYVHMYIWISHYLYALNQPPWFHQAPYFGSAVKGHGGDGAALFSAPELLEETRGRWGVRRKEVVGWWMNIMHLLAVILTVNHYIYVCQYRWTNIIYIYMHIHM
jgi:hypothetical protein